MTSMDHSYFIEPIDFLLSSKLLSGWNDKDIEQKFDIIKDLDLALQLENAQELPEGYGIWSDYFPNAVAPFYTTDLGRLGRQAVEAHGAKVWEQLGNFQIELQKKKVRKTITEFEDFWSATAFDVFEQLKMIAVGRYCARNHDNSALENVYLIYASGFYPCGQRTDGRLVALDPRILKR